VADLRVRFLGSGDPFASGGRLQATILLETAQKRYLLDCGATAMVGLARHGVESQTIDGVIISHLHGDHVGGVPLFILDWAVKSGAGADEARRLPLLIAGPAGTEACVRRVMQLYRWGDAYDAAIRAHAIEFTTLPVGRITPVGPFAVLALRAIHTPEALVLRLAHNGVTIGYSGDTGWTDALVTVAAAADLFICVAYTFATPDPTMLDHATLREQRPRLSCKRLILTHIGAELQERLAEAQEEVAHDGLLVEL